MGAAEPPFQRMRPPQNRLRLLQAALATTSHWTLSGSLVHWGDPLVPLFQLVVLIQTPTAVRLARLRRRELERFGAAALDPGGHMHQQHLDFLAWAARYDEGDEKVRSRRLHESWVLRLPCPLLRVEGTLPLPLLVGQVLACLER